MFTDYLWLLGAKQQYDRQKELGLAGLSGLLLVIFVVWQWDSVFYPLANKLGFVALADRLGLISSEEGIMTVINVTAFIFFLSLFLSLAFFILTMIGVALLFFRQSKIGSMLISIGLLVLFFPIVIFFLIKTYVNQAKSPESKNSLWNTYSSDSELKPLLKTLKDKPVGEAYFELYKEQVKRENNGGSITSMNKKLVKSFLNRAVASTVDTRHWLVGYDQSEDQWYTLFPNPLPQYASRCANRDSFHIFNAILNISKYETDTYFPNYDKKALSFHVPAMPISLDWDHKTKRIMPSVMLEDKLVSVLGTDTVKTEQMVLKSTLDMPIYKVKTSDFTKLFKEISNFTLLDKWNRSAHAAVYLIPQVYLANIVNPKSSELIFNNAIKHIPFLEEFYPVYAADVQEHLNFFNKTDVQWTHTWHPKLHESRNQ